MVLLKSKVCIVCGAIYQPTRSCSKYCSKGCKRTIQSKRVYDWRVKTGKIKDPGVGSGNAQGFGPSHHSHKPDAPRRYLDFKRAECERCGSIKNLVGHHGDRDRSNNSGSNIETLCRSCHAKEHKLIQNLRRGKAKLTDEQVRSIRLDERIYSVIGKEYGITKKSVSRIKRKVTWKHLE